MSDELIRAAERGCDELDFLASRINCEAGEQVDPWSIDGLREAIEKMKGE